jgi:hypothetical protein
MTFASPSLALTRSWVPLHVLVQVLEQTDDFSVVLGGLRHAKMLLLDGRYGEDAKTGGAVTHHPCAGGKPLAVVLEKLRLSETLVRQV